MTTLLDWYEAFAEAATWQPHPVVLTHLVWDEENNKLRSVDFMYRGFGFHARAYNLHFHIFRPEAPKVDVSVPAAKYVGWRREAIRPSALAILKDTVIGLEATERQWS
jgi:hypothetical protein